MLRHSFKLKFSIKDKRKKKVSLSILKTLFPIEKLKTEAMYALLLTIGQNRCNQEIGCFTILFKNML